MADVERALREVGLALELPATPAVAPVVADRVAAAQRPFAWRRAAAVALAAAALAVAVALAVPPARSELLRFLGLRGVTIERVERLPVFDMRTGRALGVRVSLEDARKRAAFTLLVPAAATSVSFDSRYPGGAVTFAWRDRRILLTEFRGETTPFIDKSAGSGTRIEPVLVDGAPGFWLAGARHFVAFRDADGRVIESSAAGNVLLWERGEVTLRLEGNLTKAEALRIARSLR